MKIEYLILNILATNPPSPAAAGFIVAGKTNKTNKRINHRAHQPSSRISGAGGEQGGNVTRTTCSRKARFCSLPNSVWLRNINEKFSFALNYVPKETLGTSLK